MARNMAIDSAPIALALEISGERGRKAAVTKAQKEFAARRKQKLLVAWMGKRDWGESLASKKESSRDWKEARLY